LLAHGRWFSLGTLVSSSTKIGRHDIAESGVKTPKIKQKSIEEEFFVPCVYLDLISPVLV
jgi:hypothetical protein